LSFIRDGSIDLAAEKYNKAEHILCLDFKNEISMLSHRLYDEEFVRFFVSRLAGTHLFPNNINASATMVLCLDSRAGFV